MGLKYKIDVLAELRAKGYNSVRLRKEKLMGEHAIQSIRRGSSVSWSSVETLCRLLKCQPGDILEYEEEAE